MRIVRTIEGVCGVLSGVAGLAALGVAFWAPLDAFCSSATGTDGTTTQYCGPTSYVAANGIAGVVPVLIGFGIVFVAVALGAARHAWSGGRAGRGMLWVATAFLVFGNILTLLSIGVFLFPSTALALVASILAIVGRRAATPLAA